MLVIIRENKSIAIDWKAVESIKLETTGNNDYLIITTKSESFIVVNPTLESGEGIDFNLILKAWIDCYTAWNVHEGRDSSAPTLNSQI